jgi:predicted DNA-binding transcriptional regulator AlpA
MEFVDVQSKLDPSLRDQLVSIPVLSDDQLAVLLNVTREWVRSHKGEIPGFFELGVYIRFRVSDVVEWLGSLDPLWDATEVARLMQVPTSWIYANADSVPGVVRLGRYIRFRPSVLKPFIGMSETCQ